MNILVIGSGGREHAIIRRLRANPDVETIWALPGNGGIAVDATCVPIRATDVDAIVEFAAGHPVDLAVVTPDDPLCLGLVDRLTEIGVHAFGPTAAAARIEGSKAFAKDLMRQHGIPTAAYEVFDDAEAALEAVRTASLPVVIKADGLALGKGVTVASTRVDAEQAIRAAMVDRRFGSAGARVVIEEFMPGVEASLMLLTDGVTYKLMPSAMDHKRALSDDLGPNTGGMGAIAPHPLMRPEVTRQVEHQIVVPILDALREAGCPFKGCLYVGLMLVPNGPDLVATPKVVEFNCRFGDPEAQAVLALLESDLLTALEAVVDGTLASTPVEFRDGAACCVVLASGGYPGVIRTGLPVTGWQDVTAELDFAGVVNVQGGLATSGGRVVGVTATAPTLEAAIESAYASAQRVHFDGVYMRDDIGRKALQEAAQPSLRLMGDPEEPARINVELGDERR